MKIDEDKKTINDEIQYMIDKSLNQQAKPELVTITKIYSDHVNCETENGDVLEYIPIISRNNLKVNDKGIMFLLSNGNYYIIA